MSLILYWRIDEIKVFQDKNKKKMLRSVLIDFGLLELGRLGWSNKDLVMLYKLNETANIIVKTPV